MTKPLVIFRVDASSLMGMGHLMRCRAVAEALVERGAQVVFAMVEPSDACRAILAGIPAELALLPGPAGGSADLQELLALQAARRAIVAVADGYHLSDDYLRAVGQGGALALFLDAPDRDVLPAQVIIDAAPLASAEAYARVAPHARMLLGAHYALIRRDLRQAMAAPRTALSERTRVLITFGGADPLGLTKGVAARLLSLLPPDVGITALVGGADRRAQELSRFADTRSPRLEVVINPPSVAPCFVAAGLVVTAGGGTIGELVALGLPALVAVVADNQAGALVAGPYPAVDARAGDVIEQIAQRAAALWHDQAARERLAREVDGLVDGLGATRVADALLANHIFERIAS